MIKKNPKQENNKNTQEIETEMHQIVKFHSNSNLQTEEQL